MYSIFFFLTFKLIFFKILIINYRENNGVESLGLNFMLNIKDHTGNLKTIELKPNGKNIPVTDSNKNEYIK